ncbi:D-beta-D-heptose 7-phosphate kinase/D-beta-D-heptose 1-phosphate adenosyltransferase [Chthoniobacter flavus]|uniref:bifunctional heptose 7-phosphate kinase/heptose 1-phosphate adenyltransferase n=1 Tax=Chthoniobacter flavus TaxID=191863 RepID=UPI0010477F1A|nr:bifunctional ADP-heptose synthase [Chthoniobacter flavus]TCO88285.1 D-beta-D-heptose 7-phosphate kinase/D-beta-D-heptose 1-phosphate adenosyltransferase [Chthoniobacter flavus]
MNRDRVAALTRIFADKRILVIGDLMLDEFLWGKVSRISPEAPVPVVEVVREEWFPGGAANVARNLAEFSKHVRVLGFTGVCSHAEHLKKLLTSEGINIDTVQSHACYQTIVKTRIIARQQHVVRIDREKKLHVQPEHAAAALAQIEALLPEIDAIIVEDYGKGLLAQPFAEAICDLANRAGKILAVDPNPHNPLAWRHVSVIKPNRVEAFASAGLPQEEPIDPPTEDTALLEVGRVLSEKWDADNLLITLGEQGVLLFRHDAPPYHAPTRAREVFDVSGAGDTVIALYTLALSAGATPAEAAEIANHASGVVVGKLGTATVTPAELLASFVE